jgi:uncharacterized protein DUF6308
MTAAIVLANGTRFEDPEGRVREYCRVEVYRRYDGKLAINNSITMNDVNAANELYAMIDKYDPKESSRIVGAKRVEVTLAAVDDLDLALMSDEEWAEVAPGLRAVLSELTAIRGVGIAKATKLLHLKRPHLLPVLDSFVVKFLTGRDPVAVLDRVASLEVGLTALRTARADLVANRQRFKKLGAELGDLPIPLTYARMYDILCWTQEKWVVRGLTQGRYGPANQSAATLWRRGPN